MEKIERLAPDTSVIIEGIISKKIEKKELSVEKIIVHEAVVSELEHQANQNKAIGYLGLDELDRLRELSRKVGFELVFAGIKPRASEIRLANMGEIDAMIREMAYENDAVLFTADKIQKRVAEAKGMRIMFVQFDEAIKKLKLESYFDSTTMSVHLRENVTPRAKKGVPGLWEFAEIATRKLTRDDIQDISRELIEEAGTKREGFIEIERPGSTIIQLGKFRIVITKPPFSDGWEITAVRPVRKLDLDDYRLSEKLKERISKHAEGILIAGAPGMGKSTFAQALTEHYANQNKIVKTIEAPRDLILPDTITQYAISHADPQEIHDILLLSRPDYTVFDEMRNTNDFKLFADLRLSGIGLVGVVHATNPIDAIQRFVGRIELGVIPQIVDTVIFIKNGTVFKVLSLEMTVKVPSGMQEADLARPVVVVNDFETNKIEYELYSYGEETVVVPVKGNSTSPSKELASRAIMQEMKRYVDEVEVEVVSDHKCIVYVPEDEIGGIIGKQGKNIEQIEKKLGISIDVKELERDRKKSANINSEKQIQFEAEVTKKHVLFRVDPAYANKSVNIFIDGDYVVTAHIGKDGRVKMNKNNKMGKVLVDSVNSGEGITLVIA